MVSRRIPVPDPARATALLPARATALLAALAAAVAVLLGPAAPAEAHGTADSAATSVASNARSAVLAEDLPEGVDVDVLQNGLALRVRNHTASPVTVPEVGLLVPPGESAQWHHDDAHPSVPGAAHPWQVVIEVDGVVHTVHGEVVWLSGRSPWPWLAGAGLLAVGIGLAAWWSRRTAWLAVPLGAAVLGSLAQTVLELAGRTAEGSRWGLLGDYLPQAGCWVLGAVAVVLLARDRPEAGGLGALAAAGLVLVTLVSSGTVLGAATVLVPVPADADRVLVAATVGLASGVLAGLIATTRIRAAALSAS